MKKDIFIDNNIASKFSNPMDPEYKKLIVWLMNSDIEESKRAYLVTSQKLLKEYLRSAMHAKSPTSIPVIIAKLTIEKRIITVSNEQIRAFQNEYYTKTVIKKLTSNEEDREHIPVVLLSERKYALSYDQKFCNDLRTFPGFTVRVEKRPEDLPYAD
ncbi:MAG: hypothetical protein V4543_11900 [Bacteroidota bacterium]